MNATTGASPVVLAYAQSLFNVAKKQGVVRQVTEESKALRTILKESPTFREFLDGPQITREQKRKVVAEVLAPKLNPITLNLFNVVIQRDRAGLVGEILEEFQNVAERAEGIYPAQVSTARELGFQEKLRLKAALEKYAQCHLRINYSIEPHILGGVVFKFQDSLVDGSVRHKLDQLGRKLRGGMAMSR